MQRSCSFLYKVELYFYLGKRGSHLGHQKRMLPNEGPAADCSLGGSFPFAREAVQMEHGYNP